MQKTKIIALKIVVLITCFYLGTLLDSPGKSKKEKEPDPSGYIENGSNVPMPEYYRKLTGMDSVQIIFGFSEDSSIEVNFCYPNKWEANRYWTVQFIDSLQNMPIAAGDNETPIDPHYIVKEIPHEPNVERWKHYSKALNATFKRMDKVGQRSKVWQNNFYLMLELLDSTAKYFPY